MTPKEVEVHLVKNDIGAAEISRQLKKRYGLKLSASYCGMVLRGERTAYKHRARIARLAGLKVADLPNPHGGHNGLRSLPAGR